MEEKTIEQPACRNKIAAGIDLGFGDVKKVVYTIENGKVSKPEMAKWPTAVARAGRSGIEGLDSSTTKYKYSGKEYIVGVEAVNSDKVISCREVDKLVEVAPLFVHKAMESKGLQSVNGSLFLGMGLPIADFKTKRETLKQRVSDFKVSGRQVRVPNLTVFPQAMGIYLDVLLKPNGKKNKQWDGRTMVILDIGFNTIDILCVDKGITSRDESMMKRNLGVCCMTRELGKELQKMGMDCSEQGVKRALDERKVLSYGDEKDLDEIIKGITADYAEYICDEIKVWLGDFLQRSEKVVLAGGGAYYIENDFAKIFNKDKIFVPPLPEYSNARGYAKALVSTTLKK